MDATKVKSQPLTNSLTSTNKTPEAQQAQKRAAEALRTQQQQQVQQQAQVKKTQEQAQRPNVNGQGKMIGTRLSVTA